MSFETETALLAVLLILPSLPFSLSLPPSLFLPPSTDPCKYFGCELGAQTQMDHKIGRYIVNGAHESNKLQDMLDGFIKKFVLCAECDNPETDLVSGLKLVSNEPLPLGPRVLAFGTWCRNNVGISAT